MNLSICTTLPRTPENGTWYRAVLNHHLTAPLGSGHTKAAASRFNGGDKLAALDQFEALYFGGSHLVAQFEFGAMLGTPYPGNHAPNPTVSYLVMNVQVILRDVIDLTDVARVQTPLETNVQELTGDWRGYRVRSHMTTVPLPIGIAPTQELGRALFLTGVEGFRAISARVPYEKTLTIFPKNLRSGSSITFFDHTGAVIDRIGP